MTCNPWLTVRCMGVPAAHQLHQLASPIPQTDIHTETATVREALLFSARLRLPAKVSDADISE